MSAPHVRYAWVTAATLGLGATAACGASDGTLGPTSTARMDISLQLAAPPVTIPATVGVSGLKDLALPELRTDGTIGEGRSEICLYHTTPTFSVRISQPGSTDGAPLRLVGPDGATLPLSIGLRGTDGEDAELPDAGTLNGLQGNRRSPTCADGDRNVFFARSRGGSGAEAGVYEGIIELLIAPE